MCAVSKQHVRSLKTTNANATPYSLHTYKNILQKNTPTKNAEVTEVTKYLARKYLAKKYPHYTRPLCACEASMAQNILYMYMYIYIYICRGNKISCKKIPPHKTHLESSDEILLMSQKKINTKTPPN